MIVCGYQLDLYCEDPDCVARREAGGRFNGRQAGSEQFGGDSKREAFSNARMAGWELDEKRDVCICPKHARKGATR